MALTDSTEFDKIVLSFSGIQTYIAVYNGDVGVAYFEPSFGGTYDPTTDAFEIMDAAIKAGTATEYYSTGYGLDGTLYTDETLPDYLSHWRNENPFHLATLRAETESVEAKVHNVIAYKWGDADTTPDAPSIDYDSFAELKDGLGDDGWSFPVPATPDGHQRQGTV